jgi:hypothetical protein
MMRKHPLCPEMARRSALAGLKSLIPTRFHWIVTGSPRGEASSVAQDYGPEIFPVFCRWEWPQTAWMQLRTYRQSPPDSPEGLAPAAQKSEACLAMN